MDNLTPEQRRLCMSHIREKNTQPELIFRKYIWKAKIRGYRLNRKDISGKPDLFFPKKRVAVFIDGCFWHKCPIHYKNPKSNKSYWIKKIKRNGARDLLINDELKAKDIIVLRFWVHEIKENIDQCCIKLLEVLN